MDRASWPGAIGASLDYRHLRCLGHWYLESLHNGSAHAVSGFVLVGIAGGTIAGLAQAWGLRDYSRAAFWIPATILSSLAGWLIGVRVGFWAFFRWSFNPDLRNENLPAQVGALILGIVSASLSAPVLIWILRHPKPQPAQR
jgi:hypothetical protein